jgi:hypothetical protein
VYTTDDNTNKFQYFRDYRSAFILSISETGVTPDSSEATYDFLLYDEVSLTYYEPHSAVAIKTCSFLILKKLCQFILVQF